MTLAMYFFRRFRSCALLLLAGVALQACGSLHPLPETTARRVDRAIAAGDTAQAVRVLGAWVREDDTPPERFIQLGALYREEGTIAGRLHAQLILEHALARFPDHSGVLLELGKTYYRQTFFSDASRCFNRVLELDPGQCEANYYIAMNWYRKWRHVQVYTEYIENARQYFRTVIECDASNSDAFFRYAFATFVLGDTAEAGRICEALLVEHPDAWKARFLLGCVVYHDESFDECQDHFNAALNMLEEGERDAFADIAILLPDSEREDYARLKRQPLEDARRAFWAAHDPDLTTRINERYLEHIQRMFLSDVLFSHRSPYLRGWETERGMALIKFGWPQRIGTTLKGKFTSGRMEIWSYHNERYAFRFYFRDEFLNGNYLVPSEPEYIPAAQALYADEPVTSLDNLPTPVPGRMEVYSFRHSDYSSDIYLAVRIDVDSLKHRLDPRSAGGFVARVAFFDDLWRPSFYSADTLGSEPFTEHARNGDRWFYMVKQFDLPFDRHRIAFSLQDQTPVVQSVLKGDVSTLAFFSDSLTLSDILLHQSPPRRDDGAHIARHGGVYFPNPGAEYRPGEKLGLYVEIYNLGVLNAKSEYDVTYSIYEVARKSSRWNRIKHRLKWVAGFRSPPPPVISQTIHRSGRDHDAVEDLVINIDQLRPGRYDLTVTVFDQNASYAAKRVHSFAKIGGSLN